ncbi:hypothetical protein HPP92_019570 [Vanilla planifolia]|uniref:Homeobox domain-containing protein n=1 Tax=Vanilla planifolia TaxID=51239 RepID=A0A835Q3J7_VANPL|nr:hypothetical protein HPP92_019570 [Vanilla planifolia]
MGEAVDDARDATLVLRLGWSVGTSLSIGRHRKRPHSSSTKKEPSEPNRNTLPPGPSLSLGLPLEGRSQPTQHSSFSHRRKMENDTTEAEKPSPRGSDEEEEGGARKKLRLTKEQSALLEDRFKEHSTLNPKLKLALAKQLNLRPRQVEVWFQNRRARTKLKQTEVDCDFLRRCCETLKDENRRLQRELQELRTLKLSAAPVYMQLPAATLAVCPSCEGTLARSGGDSKPVVAMKTLLLRNQGSASHCSAHYGIQS